MATTCRAHHHVMIIALFVVAAFALAGGADFSRASRVVARGSVSCLDCDDDIAARPYLLSGIMVSVKCGDNKKLGTVATTREDGSFEATLHTQPPPDSAGCHAKILGGAHQLYVPKDTSEPAKMVEAPAGHGRSFTIAEQLRFYSRCPNEKCEAAAGSELGSSKTVDLPVPSEWGLAPTTYYLPFVPIIGIP